MGRAEPGMEDDGPVADACKMPSFIGNFEEGRMKLSRNLPTQTSFVDGKVGRSVRDLHRRVTGSNSRSSLDGGDGEPEERSGGEERDAEGNNNNNCSSSGGDRLRTSAVDILRRNFGVVKSPSLRLDTDSRMHENQPGDGSDDAFSGHGGQCEHCRESDRETGEAGTENEPTSRESAAQCRHVCDNVDESVRVRQHVYCTVYCIANDSHREDAEDNIRPGEAVTSDSDVETGRGVGPSPEPPLYTLEDLVDPFGDMSHQMYAVRAGADSVVQSCRVCLEDKTIALLPCCRKAVCSECMKLYVTSQVRVAKPNIGCPIPECSGYLEEGEVISHLANEDVERYHYFLELNKLDSSTKPCPQCSHFTSLKKQNTSHSEHKYKIQCENCQFVWCFKCHAPWHNGLKCRDYRKGDKLLRTWASVIEHGQRNAQKCPRCKIHIQRTEGCDHMTCTQCNTNFCYRCGERYRHLRFFGDHTSNLSVFGCKYRYLPDKPHLRRLIRGSVCATKVLIAPVVLLLVVVFGALALVIGLVVFPVYYVCKRRKKQRTQGSGRWI